MPSRLRILLATLIFIPFAHAQTKTPDAPVQTNVPSDTALNPALPTVFIVGDSTARNGADLGWGDHFAPLFDTTRINVANRARAGRSSRTYINEGLWAHVLSEMKPGDFVLIQMGHNDGGNLGGAKPRGTLKGIGEETQDVPQTTGPLAGKVETVHTYGWYLRKYIAEARARGATPILLTPTIRNIWKDGQIERDMGYTGFIRDVAAAEHVPVADMASIAADRLQALGPEKTALLFPIDHTHSSAAGAALNARDVAAALRVIHSPLALFLLPVATDQDDRHYTISVMQRLADPVLNALAEDRLHEKMPVEGPAGRRESTHLEALGRLLAGMAPWLELGPDATTEGRLREHYIVLARRGIHNAVTPASADYMNFTHGSQRLVDAAFLAQALLRAPHQLWDGLDAQDQKSLVAALKATRDVTPGNNNWVLFSATIEAALWRFTGECNQAVIESAVTKHMGWYKGDGIYGDGPVFHWDYYNAFVIQPMLLDIMAVAERQHSPLAANAPVILERARRYAEVEEELISPEATFPVIGRSSTYRFGALQVLSQMALLHQLPAAVSPGVARSALTAVVRRMIEAPGTFDSNGWLQIGTVGHQPVRGEPYISTGSLYLCAAGLLHLGLPADDPFWTAPEGAWTQKRIWAGENVPADHAIAH